MPDREYGKSIDNPPWLKGKPRDFDQGIEEIGVKTPGGFGLVFRGRDSFTVVVMVLLVGIFALLLYMHDANGSARAAAILAGIDKLNMEAKHGHEVAEKSDSTQRMMIYVLTLSQSEREKLHLEEPPELRGMQR